MEVARHVHWPLSDKGRLIMKTTELAQSGNYELNADQLDRVSGGDKARSDALVGLYKAIESLELSTIDVEPVVRVPMKL